MPATQVRRITGIGDFASDAERFAFVERLATDFVFFIEALFALHRDYAEIGEMERDICGWVATCGHPRRGVLGPRGIGKTHLISAGYAAWRLLRDPDTKILIVSKSKIPSARDIVRLIRGWLSNVWFLKHLNPAENPNELGTDSIFQFDVTGSSDAKTPSVIAQGVEGMITGSRAHLVLCDDIETDENCKTVAARHDLEQKTKEFFNVAKFGGREILYVGTYHHDESVYLRLAESGYVFRTWPFAYPSQGEKFLNLAPLVQKNLDTGKGKPGEPVFSHRYTGLHVAEAQAHGRETWEKQYQLLINRGAGAKYPLKLNDLIVFPMLRDKAPVSIAWGTTNDRGGSTALEDIPVVGWDGDRLHAPIFTDKEWSAFTGTKAWIDPAGKGKDLTGVAIVGHLSGILWLKGWYGLPGGGSTEKLDEIVALLRLHGARDVYCETNIDVFDSYFPMLEESLQRAMVPPGVDESIPGGWVAAAERRHARSDASKENRIIDALEPVISSHRLVVHPDCIRPKPDRKRIHETQWMIAALTRERGALKEDGPIDALAGAVSEWQNVLRLNPQKAALASKERVLDKLLEEHYRATGRPVVEPRWQATRR